MPTLKLILRFAGFMTLIALLLPACSGSTAENDDQQRPSSAGDEVSDPSPENTVPEPMAEQVEEIEQMTTKNVLVEIRVPRGYTSEDVFSLVTAEIVATGFKLDPAYQPIPVSPQEEDIANLEAADETIVLIRGTIAEEQEEELRNAPRVIAVWSDTPIEPVDN